MIRTLFLVTLLCLFAGCSPLRTSALDQSHQLELTLHEVQTNLDDLRHDINNFQTELQILDGRIKHYENALANLKQQDLDKQQGKIEQLSVQLKGIDQKIAQFEKNQNSNFEDMEKLALHANETSIALSQFKTRTDALEQDLIDQHRRFEELAKVKGHIESLAKSAGSFVKTYKVKSGDSLERIARAHKTTVDRIKKINGFDQDRIVVGQEIKLPID